LCQAVDDKLQGFARLRRIALDIIPLKKVK
jgi:hypothetical protein